MKRLILTLFIAIFSVSSMNAQNIKIFSWNGATELTGDTLTFWHPVSPDVNEGDFTRKEFAKIVNASSGGMNIDMKRIVLGGDSIPGTLDLACWGQNCYGPKNANLTPIWIFNDPVFANAGDTAGGIGLYAYFRANDQTGLAKYEYQFYNTEDPNTTGSIFVKWSITRLTDINEIADAAQNMSVYPNPAEDYFMVDLNTGVVSDNQEIIVRDMLGKVVLREAIPSLQETFQFSTQQMNGGVYFVSYAVEGEILKTNKLVIK